ncbi:MAG TPA: biotin carboxylase N-terminal domain-containing protein [Acidimicrobiia bacterium]|nr:biotin carboxylase N-terminal domain-containing protein [Acidimicrobiia bacterium]
MRILVANRGEIARRIIRTVSAMSHESVAIYADPDAHAPFTREATRAVRLGPADLASSYLSIDRIVTVGLESGADAVHPGYGFLSENAAFARAVIDAGMTWIGPRPESIDAMGSKIEARRLALASQVAVVPGFDASQDPADLARAAERIGYPVLVKASAGGGGKGIRIVSATHFFAEELAAAMEEARRSFGDDRVIVERYVTRPRHVEVQVVGDKHGAVFHLGTRECSVQRRYQKLLEEAPAPNLRDDSRHGMQEAATALARQIGYDSVGTVEFVVDDETGAFFFLEMNTRLQVEHPVTEYVTGCDLVELQIRIAAGERIDLSHVEITGHAFEARINAEDAWEGFAPQVGTVTDLVVPDWVRWDSAVEVASEVTPHYDPMIAKLIVGGSDRESARRGLARALDRLVIGGLRTNTGFHRWLIDQAPVAEGRVTTRFLDETALPAPPSEEAAAAAAAVMWTREAEISRSAGVWNRLGAFRITPHAVTRVVHLEGVDVHDIVVGAQGPAGGSAEPAGTVSKDDRRVVVVEAGQSFTFTVLTTTQRWSPRGRQSHGPPGAVTAPFPGVMAEVRAAAGDAVEPGQVLAVLEAMKMLHPLAAQFPATVSEVRVAAGDNVSSGQVLITFDTQNGDSE